MTLEFEKVQKPVSISMIPPKDNFGLSDIQRFFSSNNKMHDEMGFARLSSFKWEIQFLVMSKNVH